MPAPADYVSVAERIVDFRAKYPDGCLRPADPSKPFEVVTIGDTTWIVVVAAAYRSAEDPCPGIGMAWEQFPGATNFTRTSELQNAETSAWGRAIIAVGASDAKRGIATAEEAQHRSAQGDASAPRSQPPAPENPEPIDEGRRAAITTMLTDLPQAEEQRVRDAMTKTHGPTWLETITQAQADAVLAKLDDLHKQLSLEVPA